MAGTADPSTAGKPPHCGGDIDSDWILAEAGPTPSTPATAPSDTRRQPIRSNGECVIALRTGPSEQSLQCVFSATKGAVAACANLLVERGVLDLEAPVSRYWPEFGSHGKEATLVRWILEHRSGVLAPDRVLSPDEVADWNAVCAALAEATPVWQHDGDASIDLSA
jgi:CubicO group peptidase (beta-lactamase class C family)